ncbi:hypothetical protein [Mesorhizobium sp. KR2-14]|uniref:hypothetical protein n=1 Tax=Mesorhizobium sp. KR2-14 TaxID=3156610 RepID=UPI0032B424E7
MLEDDNADWFDPDIAALSLDFGEKAGLQIYRNYTRSFEQHAIKRFVEVLNKEAIDLSQYEKLTSRIASEEGRYLPVIICAFADDLLKKAFKAALPDGIPGGKASMMSGYGPISDFAKRIQLAYAFDVLSGDLMSELDKVRVVRNRISHSWDVFDLTQFFEGGSLSSIHPIEELLAEREVLCDLQEPFDPLVVFRIRMVWIVGRLVYEVAAYHRAKTAKLEPHKALYGKPVPEWLGSITRIAFNTTRTIAANEVRLPK